MGGVGDTGDSRVIAPGFRKNALLNLTGDRDFVTLHNGLSPLWLRAVPGVCLPRECAPGHRGHAVGEPCCSPSGTGCGVTREPGPRHRHQHRAPP